MARNQNIYLCPIMLFPPFIAFISGHMYGLIACELSHVGTVVEPGDITFEKFFVSQSSTSV